jgi:hypothetical protein
MTDVAYLCHNCGSVHEVESIRENLILDLRTAASYELSRRCGRPDPRARFLNWRMTWGLAQALWPGYLHHPHPGWGLRLVPGPPARTSDRPVPFRAATGGIDAAAGSPALAGARGRLASISADISTALPRHDQSGGNRRRMAGTSPRRGRGYWAVPFWEQCERVLRLGHRGECGMQ